MKIELVQGCIADRLDVDGKPIMDMSEDELKDILIKVANNVAQKELQPYERLWITESVRVLVEYFSDTIECSERPCECCGDFIETYTLEI